MPRVASTSFVVLAFSPSMPPYTWPISLARMSKLAYLGLSMEYKAKERAATAWALMASSGHKGSTSFATTPYRYCSRGRVFTTFRFFFPLFSSTVRAPLYFFWFTSTGFFGSAASRDTILPASFF